MEYKEDKLKEIMGMAKVEMPFGDFEDKLMMRIEQAEQEKVSLKKTKRYALVFFVFGTLFGMGLNYLLADFVQTSVEASKIFKNNILLLSQMIYVVLIVLFSDKMLRLIKLRKLTK